MLRFRSLALPILLLLGVQLNAHGSANAQPADAQVVLRIAELGQDAHALLAREVGRDPAASLEYACLWTGVVVLRFSDVPLSDRADAITYARRLLQAAGISQSVEFLFVLVEPRGTGKC